MSSILTIPIARRAFCLAMVRERCTGACAEGEIGMIDFWHEVDGSGGASLRMPAGGSLLRHRRRRFAIVNTM